MAVKRMDNVGIVVEDLDAAVDFFRDLGLELEGRATIDGEWAGRVTGLGDQHVEIAMMRTPDGHGRLELSRFLRPAVAEDHRTAPVNALGYLRVMFAVEDLEATLAKLRPPWRGTRRRGRRLSGRLPALLYPRAGRAADRAGAGASVSAAPRIAGRGPRGVARKAAAYSKISGAARAGTRRSSGRSCTG